MDFPIGFPARLKPRAEASVLKAIREFPESEMGPRIDAGLRAFAEIAIEAARNGEWVVELAHGALDQFLHYLIKNYAFGGMYAHFTYVAYPFAMLKDTIKSSPEWIGYMEQLDAIARREDRKTFRPKRKQQAKPKYRGTIHSPKAARRMETFLEQRGIGMTEFATKAGTTDRTLRSFRKTGKIRRSILEGIAGAMGTTKEKLLR